MSLGDRPAVILAGGRSRRMGGIEKAFAALAGRPLIEHVIVRLRTQATALAINANGDALRFAGLGCPVIPDAVPGLPGPLAGFLAALDWVAADGPAACVLVVPVDCPLLPPDLAARLFAASAGARIAFAASAGRAHPVIAVLPPGIREKLRAALAGGRAAKVADFVTAQPHCRVDWPAAPADPFLNVNTPADLDAAARALGRG